MNKKFAVVTGTRAEYGLLVPLIRKINNDPQMEVILMVTGAHLSESHGKTIEFIKKDGFKIDYIVDMEIQGDRETDICDSMAVGLKKFSEIFNNEYLDAIIVLGDRYELLPVCTAAIIHRVPIVHIHGGEVTEGAVDDIIRHSITKMASIQFTSLDIYRNRVIQMGESPDRAYAVGALAVDNIIDIKLMSRSEISEYTKVDFTKKIALMTYHPVTLNSLDESIKELKEIMKALLQTNLITLITMPNADAGNDKLYNIILEYTKQHPSIFQLRKNLGQKGYLSTMKYAQLMIGNSSSGISESSHFKLPVVNVGDRQKGRFRTPNIIDCKGEKEEILKSIELALSKKFRGKIERMENPYGDGDTSQKIVGILKEIDFGNKEKLIKKRFYDLT